MTIIQSLVLGVVQGITEFLPISSSGHLVFVPVLFGWGDQGLAFDVVLHVGTLVAVVAYFRERLFAIVKSFPPLSLRGVRRDDVAISSGVRQSNGITTPSASLGKRLAMTDRKLGWLLLFSTVPAIIVGLGFEIFDIQFRSTNIVAFNLIFWGIILWIADRHNNNLSILNSAKPDSQSFNLESVGWRKTLFIGCAQAIALIPGTSRSGITMTAGLFAKFDRKTAAEFSFLMSVPIIAMAGALKIVQLFKYGLGDLQIISLVVGFMASMVSGFFAIKWLMNVVQKWGFVPFAVYRVVVGVVILLTLSS